VHAAPAFPDLTERVIDHYVVPHFKALEDSTHRLAGDVAAACAGDNKRFAAVEQDFGAAVEAWAGVEFLRFGPMSVMGRPERLVYWPDPRGITARQLRVLIAKRDESALDPQALAGKSAAVQGLTVLEALLADGTHPLSGTDETSRYRCRLAVSVAQNVANIAHDMVRDWNGSNGWRQRMLSAGPKNANYRTPEEPAADFARALITGLQMMQDRQIMPLIAAQTSGKPARLPFEKAGLSARYIAAGVASLQGLYEAMGLGNPVPEKKAWMPRWIAGAFTRLAHDAPAALKESELKRKDKERERRLRILRFQIDGIRKLIGRELAPLAGLTIGFNELDGD
jgi:predicted lipoprotein